MKGRKELLEALGINCGYISNNLLPIEWYNIVHRAYCLGFVDREEWHDTLKGAPPKEGWYVVMIEYDMDGEHDEVPVKFC